jgi:hypothetical protein
MNPHDEMKELKKFLRFYFLLVFDFAAVVYFIINFNFDSFLETLNLFIQYLGDGMITTHNNPYLYLLALVLGLTMNAVLKRK